MRLILTVMILIFAGAALFLGVCAMIFGIMFSSHPVKGDPDASYFVHLWLGLQFAFLLGGAPAALAIVLNFIRRRLPRD